MFRHSIRSSVVGVAVVGLLAASCGGSSSTSSPTTAAPATTAATATTTTATAATTATTVAVTATTAAAAPTTTALGKPTGPSFSIGLVNSEGTPGLDFPDIRKYTVAAVSYLNEHGGIGGRPIDLKICVVKGSPETSQVCAQELAGKKVELVILGLDLFPDYKTYAAANIPVIGMLPILPGDYTAKALFLTGGNATVMGSIAAVARNHFKAKNIGIVSADNAGANASAAALEASLKKAGIAFKTVKGGDNETDAGFQGLLREATKDKPEVLVSLYADAGCIGMMRARASLAIATPVVSTGICGGSDVIKVVGDDAVGWMFAGVQTDQDTPERAILQKILAPVVGVAEGKVDTTALGLGGLGFLQIMSLANYGNQMVKAAKPVTGASLYEYLGTTKGLTLYGGATAVECGSSASYPAVCSFIFPFAEYTKGGKVLTVKGLEAVSSKELLP